MEKKSQNEQSNVMDVLFTTALFTCVVASTPLLVFSYIVITVIHSLWFSAVSFLYPDLEFIKGTTLRTLLDTHRNQGVVAVLLTVKGQPNPASVRRHVEELARRKDKHGKLTFPHLSDCLVVRCNTYAWQKGNADLEQNFIFAPYVFRGRPVNEVNIQECVSDIVSKYLPSGQPPWQIFTIPTAENHHYLLLRLHHILLTDGLNIADMLPLIPPVRSTSAENSESKSALANVLDIPVDIPKLKDHLMEELANRWNEFISNNDPLEKMELYKRNAGFFEFLAITLIVVVSTIKDCRKNFPMIKNDLSSLVRYAKNSLCKESRKRQVSMTTFVTSIFVTCNPINVATTSFKHFWHVFLWIITIPFRINAEIKALHTCFSLSYCAYPNTTVGFIYNYMPLFYKAAVEVLAMFTVVFNTPRVVYDELCKSYETIQTVTLCGRKVVAWSEPVKLETIRSLSKSTGMSETEIVLATTSEALSRFMVLTNNIPPKEIPITARNVNSNYIFLTGNNVKAEEAIGGMLCFDLPILDSRKDANLFENLRDIKHNFAEARRNQQLTFLLSILQTKYGFLTKMLPSTVLGVALKYLSLKYAVAFSEVSSRQPFVTQKTIWGQEVSSVIYWRPPQANVSISLCINQYGQNVTFGVMCDAQLAPNHNILVRGFPEYVKDLQIAIEGTR